MSVGKFAGIRLKLNGTSSHPFKKEGQKPFVVVGADGSVRFYDETGWLHRIIYKNGDKAVMFNGAMVWEEALKRHDGK